MLTTEALALAALRSYLSSLLPVTVHIVRAEQNRVAQPANSAYVVMTPILRERLSTNWFGFSDTVFTGSIAGTTLSVASFSLGLLTPGAPIVGTGVLPGTYVTGLGGQDGIGSFTIGASAIGATATYTVNLPQTVGEQTLYGGRYDATQPTKVTVQLNFYGSLAADSAQAVSTLLRDFTATEFFTAMGLPVMPLYAGEPRQAPFVDAQSQYEINWTVDVALQVNASVTVAQQFANQLQVGLLQVDATYPVDVETGVNTAATIAGIGNGFAVGISPVGGTPTPNAIGTGLKIGLSPIGVS